MEEVSERRLVDSNASYASDWGDFDMLYALLSLYLSIDASGGGGWSQSAREIL